MGAHEWPVVGWFEGLKQRRSVARDRHNRCRNSDSHVGAEHADPRWHEQVARHRVGKSDAAVSLICEYTELILAMRRRRGGYVSPSSCMNQFRCAHRVVHVRAPCGPIAHVVHFVAHTDVGETDSPRARVAVRAYRKHSP